MCDVFACVIHATHFHLLIYCSSLQVLPIAEECDRGGGGGRVRGDSGEGVRESSSGEGSQDNLLIMTHAKSLEVLIPRGKSHPHTV